MHCPNCGSRNKKHQNYCRYCGLHLPGIEKLFLSQLVFGEDTERLKRLRSVRKLIDYTLIFIGVLFFWGIFRLLTGGFDGGKDLVKLSVVAFFLLIAVDKVLGYFQRRELKTNRRDVIVNEETEQLATRETAKLIEEKPFSPVSNLTKASTELLFVEAKTKRLNE
jgi:hypothetical protein